MVIKYQGHSKRSEQARVFWGQVADEYNKGVSAQAIAMKYINPRTGKHYTRATIYLILSKLKKA